MFMMAAFLSISDLLIVYRAGATGAFSHRYGRPGCPCTPDPLAVTSRTRNAIVTGLPYSGAESRDGEPLTKCQWP